MSLVDTVKKLEAEAEAGRAALAQVAEMRRVLGPVQIEIPTMTDSGADLLHKTAAAVWSWIQALGLADAAVAIPTNGRVEFLRGYFEQLVRDHAAELSVRPKGDDGARAMGWLDPPTAADLRAERDDWKARALEGEAVVEAGLALEELRTTIAPTLARLVEAGRMEAATPDELDVAVCGLLEDLECARQEAHETKKQRERAAVDAVSRRKTSRAVPPPPASTEEAGGGVPPAPSPAPEVPLIEATEEMLAPCICSHAAERHEANGACSDCVCEIYEAEEARSEPPPSPAFPRDGFVVTRTNAKPAPAHRVFLDGTKGWTTYRENAEVFPSREAAMVAKKRGATVMHTGELSTIIVPTERSSADDEEVETITEIPADGFVIVRRLLVDNEVAWVFCGTPEKPGWSTIFTGSCFFAGEEAARSIAKTIRKNADGTKVSPEDLKLIDVITVSELPKDMVSRTVKVKLVERAA